MKKNVKEMMGRINHYRPPKAIANAMLKLARFGYSFSGHGWGIGGEDWSVIKKFDEDKSFYISLSVNSRNQCSAQCDVQIGEVDIVFTKGKPGIVTNRAIKIKNKKDFIERFVV